MIFIVRNARIDLRPGNLRKASRAQRVSRFAVLKQANDVVDPNGVPFTMALPLRTPAERTM